MKPRGCNPATYRPELGVDYNAALFALPRRINSESLASNLSPADVLRKWIERACREAGLPVPTGSKPYHTAI